MVSEETKLGHILHGNESRDAIHVALAPMVAGCPLIPAEHIGLLPDGRASTEVLETIGIVDPFLKHDVREGERFYMLLYPNTITSLRHEWIHPAFEAEDSPRSELTEKDEEIFRMREALHEQGVMADDLSDSEVRKRTSEAWLRDFARLADCPDYDELIAAASGKDLESVDDDWYSTAYRIDGEYLHFDGRDAHGEIPAEFWDHVEIMTGQKCPVRPRYFSCSC